jgi:hypothetical protein
MTTLNAPARLTSLQIDALLEGRPAGRLGPLARHRHTWLRSPEGGARCECGEWARFWYCPDNPTHLCRYRTPGPDACEDCGAPSDRSAL